MPERIKVSVILTSYNHAKYLKEAIDSVLNQTFSDLELIIWDDASTDESWQIITSYSDRRVKPFRNDVQKRAVWGVNKAISEIAAGEYIAIHHSDDIWELQKLQKQVAFLDSHPEIGAVFSNAFVITENGELLKHKANAYFQIFDQPNRTRYDWLNHFFCRGNALCHPSVLIRKTCYEADQPYRSGLGLLADLDVWIRVCLKHDIYVLPEKLVRYRVRANRTNTSTDSTTRIRRPFEFLQVLNNYRKIAAPDELMKVFPLAEKYVKPEGCDLGFALGMVALELKPYKVTELFGLNLLFEALNDPRRAKLLDELYGFTSKEFVALNSKHDVFSVRFATEQQAKLDKLSEQLAEMLNSQAWKLVIVLRKLRIVFFPPGSTREKMARFLFEPVLRSTLKEVEEDEDSVMAKSG
jgi:glycosyltransferase involved in cell wall biosynthesis